MEKVVVSPGWLPQLPSYALPCSLSLFPQSAIFAANHNNKLQQQTIN
jgi:hypothetical protein